MTETETARALLYRHGLREDVIDGALCLFAQELAGKIRAHRDHTRGAVQATKVMDFAADLISPENWARTETPAAARAVLEPSLTPADDQTTRRETVEFFAQIQQPDGTWEQSSSISDELAFTEKRLANLRKRFPECEHRLAQRNTIVIVQPLADCPACEAGIEHDVHCPTPLTHNWGCGCPTDQAPAAELRRVADETPQPETAVVLPYTHTDDDSDQLLIGVVNASTHEGDVPQVFVCARQFNDDSKEETTVYVRPEFVEQAVAAMRAARSEADRMAVVVQPVEETQR